MLIQTRPQLNHLARYMLVGFVVFILVSLLSFYNAEDIENSIRRIKKLLIFIYFIPIFLAMASTKVNLIKAYPQQNEPTNTGTDHEGLYQVYFSRCHRHENRNEKNKN